MSGNNDQGKMAAEAAFEVLMEKLSQRSIGSDKFSDADFSNPLFIRDFALSNLYKAVYQVVGEEIIRWQLKSGTDLSDFLKKVPDDYDKAIKAAIDRKALGEMLTEVDRFLAKHGSNVSQKLLRFRKGLQDGMDNALVVLSEYIVN